MLCDDASSLPKRIRQLRMELGWSLDDLAEAMGTGKGTVSNWEATTERQRIPPIGTLMALARWFGVSLDYLTGVQGADRDSPMVRVGKSALKQRFPVAIKDASVPTTGVRLRIAVAILQEAAPTAFWPARIAANLRMPLADYELLLTQDHIPPIVVERFARFADMPLPWFSLKPEYI